MHSILEEGIEDLQIEYTEDQDYIYFGSEKRFKVVPKGRRTGFTHSALNYVAELGLDPSILSYAFPDAEEGLKILWVDTIHSNIDRYVDRYLKPALKGVKKEFWNWKQQMKEFTILNTVIDFRSADNPENIEGFGYHLIILNEAGIILKGEKGRYLWENAILPMFMDFGGHGLIGGTPKGKSDKKTSKESLYSKMASRGESNFEKDKDWETIRLLPEGNAFLDKDSVKELRAEMTGALSRQELDGEFVDVGSEGIFLNKWFKDVHVDDLPERYVDIFTSWDTAFGDGEENDYSSVTVWGVGEEYLDILYHWKGQVRFSDLKDKFDEVSNGEACDFIPFHSLIEAKASGQSLIQEIEDNTTHPTQGFIPKGDKIARANSITPYFKSGKVRFLIAPWADGLKTDLANFPESGRDSVDTVSQALNYIRENVNTSIDSQSMVSRSTNMRSRTD